MNYLEWQEKLKAGKVIIRTVHGHSMTPLIRDGESVVITPDIKDIQTEDVVFCKVRGNYYVHKVIAVKWRKHRGRNRARKIYLIGNNHGHVNGWTFSVYDRIIETSNNYNFRV